MHRRPDSASQRDRIAEHRWEDQFAQFSDRITENTHQVLMQARDEAKRHDSLAVGTEHILFALLRQSDTGGALVLRQLGVDLLRVHDLLSRLIGPPGNRVRAGEAGLTPLAMQAILLAWEESRRLGQRRANPEHVLLGLWREGDSSAGQVLSSLGVGLEQARLRVMQLQREGEHPLVSGPNELGGTVIISELTGSDIEAVDAMIAAGVCTTRSEAVRWLVHAGIVANPDLFENIYRTVANVRQLRERVQDISQQAGDDEHHVPTPPI